MSNYHKVVNSKGKQLSANLSWERASKALAIIKTKHSDASITYSDWTFQDELVGPGGRWRPVESRHNTGRVYRKFGGFYR